MFRLYLVRHAAADPSARIGSLLVNPGGPGFPGTDFAVDADLVYGDDLLDRFDIIGWDPRGTGRSEPFIDCIDDYDEFYAVGDITPDDDAERQELIDSAEDFTEQCVENNETSSSSRHEQLGARHGHDPSSARRGRDQLLRVQLRLRARWRVDHALPRHRPCRRVRRRRRPQPADATERLLQQVAGFEATLATFLAQCSADPTARSTTTATPKERSTG